MVVELLQDVKADDWPLGVVYVERDMINRTPTPYYIYTLNKGWAKNHLNEASHGLTKQYTVTY
jgi:hypothetical protein